MALVGKALNDLYPTQSALASTAWRLPSAGSAAGAAPCPFKLHTCQGSGPSSVSLPRSLRRLATLVANAEAARARTLFTMGGHAANLTRLQRPAEVHAV